MASHNQSCTDEEFIDIFTNNGPAGSARILNVDVRNIYSRRKRIECSLNIEIKPPHNGSSTINYNEDYPKRIPFNIDDGVVLVGSDAHYWPEIISPGHRGFCAISKKIHPKLIILNGDVFDGVKNSRHAPIMWAKGPKVKEELAACEERTEEIRMSSPQSERIWLLGNHDMRLESKLSASVSEYEGVGGLMLSDHFPHWKIGMSLWINNDVVVKHRYKGGVHATHNNTVNAGKTIITGHLHSLKVTPFDDYNGTRWGIDTGTLSNPYGPQFSYAEDNPLNHRSGFIVLTFRNGVLLWPEIAAVVNENEIQFRGEIISV